MTPADEILAAQPCVIGREIRYSGATAPAGGEDLIWDRECPHPSSRIVRVVEEGERDGWLYFCDCHWRFLNSFMDFQKTREAALAQADDPDA